MIVLSRQRTCGLSLISPTLPMRVLDSFDELKLPRPSIKLLVYLSRRLLIPHCVAPEKMTASTRAKLKATGLKFTLGSLLYKHSEMMIGRPIK